MPAPFTATLIDDKDHPTRFASTANGFEGERWYLVDTDDPARAVSRIDTPAIPIYGDPWNAGEYSGCLCLRLEAERWGGRDEGTRRGSTWVRASYSTPAEGFEVFPTEPGKMWTEVVSGQISQTLQHGIDPGDLDPINNGDGFNINVGVIQKIVTRNWPVDFLYDIGRLDGLTSDQSFNDAAIVLPPVLGTLHTMPYAARTVQFVGFDHQVVGRSLRIRMQLAVGLSPKVKWNKKFPDGRYGITLSEARVYNEASFSGLW